MADEIPAIFLNSDGGYSAFGWGGFNVLGNRKSIDEVKSATHAKDVQQQLHDRIKAEGERADKVVAELEALQTEITEAAYRAWPEAEDCGYDAGHIIDQLAAERGALSAALAELVSILEQGDTLEVFGKAMRAAKSVLAKADAS